MAVVPQYLSIGKEFDKWILQSTEKVKVQNVLRVSSGRMLEELRKYQDI